jgi:hypothetical protein
MPHHPIHSTRIWSHSPADNRLTDLGAFDALAGLRAHNSIPYMMHGVPIELDGRIYFIGQDPFYGKRRFPAFADDTAFAGSCVLALDLRTQTFENLGIPLPEVSIHGILPAHTRGGLYLRAHYHDRDAMWSFFNLRTHRARPLSLPGMGKFQHVGPDGQLYYIDSASGELRVFDPTTDRSTTLASISMADFPGVSVRENTRISFEAIWTPGRLGQRTGIGLIEDLDAVVALDTAAGSLRVVGRLLPETVVPREQKLEAFRAWGVSKGRLIALRNRRNSAIGKVPHVELHTMDLASGDVTVHGLLRDERGRILKESNCLAIAADGDAYIGAWVYAEPGDRHISHRFMWQSGVAVDTVFARLPAAGL